MCSDDECFRDAVELRVSIRTREADAGLIGRSIDERCLPNLWGNCEPRSSGHAAGRLSPR